MDKLKVVRGQLVLQLVFILSAGQSFIFNSAYAWHDTGHMVVANIAYLNLDSKLAKKLDDFIAINSRDYEESNDFITASTWPDDIKTHGINFYNIWHYQDKYFSNDGTKLPKPYNSGKAISVLKKHFKLMGSEVTTESEKAFSLKFILHIFGDMHQPMHSASRVTQSLPRGDLGGNLFAIDDKNYKNLHSLWDSGLKSLPEFSRPLSNNNRLWLKNYSEQLMAKYPLAGFSGDKINANYRDWQRDNLSIVQDYVYNGINIGQRPTKDYLKNNLHQVEQQLVLGGYRLANKLNCLYQTDKCIKVK